MRRPFTASGSPPPGRSPPRSSAFLRHNHSVLVAALTPDGHRLFTLSGPSPPLEGRPAAPEGHAILWNLDTGEPSWEPLPFHPLRPEGPCFNGVGIRYHPLDAAGRYCFTLTSSDGSVSNVTSEVLIHRLADGARIGRPLPHQGIVPFAEFSPDSRRILAASLDGTVQVWSLPREARPLSELHEWARFLSARYVDASGRLASVDLAAMLRERATTRRP